jgi:hypothetical protein
MRTVLAWTDKVVRVRLPWWSPSLPLNPYCMWRCAGEGCGRGSALLGV